MTDSQATRIAKLTDAIVEVVQGCDPHKEEAQLREWLTKRLSNLLCGTTFPQLCECGLPESAQHVGHAFTPAGYLDA